MLNEWLWAYHKDHLQWKHVRLGAVPTREWAKLYKVGLRWADAIVYDGKNVLIIEAKIRPHLSGIAELEVYGFLFGKTPEFTKYKDKEIKPIYLTTVMDKDIEEICENKGFEYVVYAPAWVDEYWQERLGRRRV